MSEPAKFEYIKAGTVDPRSPLIVPGKPEVGSLFIQKTADDKAIITVWVWNPDKRTYEKP